MADPVLGPELPPGFGEAVERRVEFRVTARRGILDNDAVRRDGDPPAGGQPHEFRAHQPEADPLRGPDPPGVRRDRQQDKIFAK
jgi:hypothetical protein